MTDRPDRVFEIARGVRISANPEGLTKDELIDEIYELGAYANSLQTQMRALRSILQNAIKKGN